MAGEVLFDPVAFAGAAGGAGEDELGVDLPVRIGFGNGFLGGGDLAEFELAAGLVEDVVGGFCGEAFRLGGDGVVPLLIGVRRAPTRRRPRRPYGRVREILRRRRADRYGL